MAAPEGKELVLHCSNLSVNSCQHSPCLPLLHTLITCVCLDWSAHLFRDSSDKSKILPLSALELDQITSAFFCSPTRRLFAYGLILFTFTTCFFLICRMEEAELLKERFQAITVSAHGYNSLFKKKKKGLEVISLMSCCVFAE